MVLVFKKLITKLKGVGRYFTVTNPTLPILNEYLYDQELVSQLEEVVKYPDLERLLKDPVSKIYIMSTYSTSYNDLGTMLIDKRYNRKIIAVNLHSYFKGEEHLVTTGLTRIISFIKDNKCTLESIHDLYELSSTIKHLIELKGKNND